MDSIRIKRGLKAQLPRELPLGELAFCTDTRELYVGMGEGSPLRPVTNTEITEHLAEWKSKYQEVSDQFKTKYDGLEQEYANRLTEIINMITHTGIVCTNPQGDKNTQYKFGQLSTNLDTVPFAIIIGTNNLGSFTPLGLEFNPHKSVILRSPNLTQWKITVTDEGEIKASPIPSE